MKHIQKIVKITFILKERMGWNSEEISAFITFLSYHTSQLRILNENLIGEDKSELLIKAREDIKNIVSNYLQDLLPELLEIKFSNNVMECPIKMSFGKRYANYEDNKSFVIDL